jgi:hypothetical protein
MCTTETLQGILEISIRTLNATSRHIAPETLSGGKAIQRPTEPGDWYAAVT